ncbi:RNA polymerase sigma factor [Granulicella aggregans]|nr:sigma-70 family RNA polymerase sigma factor [Granulicella aggregans]
MGVLHMAIPHSIPVSSNLHGILPRKRVKRPAFLEVAATAAVSVPPVALASVDSQARTAPQQGTLLPAPPVEVQNTLERTPQQIAEQEAMQKLVRQCIAGEQHAWAQLVASQHRRIYGICYRFTNSACDAEDLTQDVFIKVYKNLNSFDTQKGSFQTWMTTLARNLLVDHFRRTRLDRASDSLDASLGSDDDGPTIGDRLMDSGISQDKHVAGLELKATIQDALKQLSPELREAVILRDLEDMDYKEIAQVLRIPEGTVKSRISRGRGELARLLQRIEGQVM